MRRQTHENLLSSQVVVRVVLKSASSLNSRKPPVQLSTIEMVSYAPSHREVLLHPPDTESFGCAILFGPKTQLSA